MSPNIKIRHLPTDQFEDRPKGIEIDTLIIHSMHNPEAKNRFSALSCKECLDKHGVSSHYLIDLSGTAWQLIPENKKAWHAGISTMPEDGREGVNAFSIGIELIGSEDTDFTEAQYQALALLTKDILSRHSIQYIYGHYDIAPGRKTDPWGLDWLRYRKMFCALALMLICDSHRPQQQRLPKTKKNSCGQPPCPLCSQAPA